MVLRPSVFALTLRTRTSTTTTRLRRSEKRERKAENWFIEWAEVKVERQRRREGGDASLTRSLRRRKCEEETSERRGANARDMLCCLLLPPSASSNAINHIRLHRRYEIAQQPVTFREGRTGTVSQSEEELRESYGETLPTLHANSWTWPYVPPQNGIIAPSSVSSAHSVFARPLPSCIARPRFSTALRLHAYHRHCARHHQHAILAQNAARVANLATSAVNINHRRRRRARLQQQSVWSRKLQSSGRQRGDRGQRASELGGRDARAAAACKKHDEFARPMGGEGRKRKRNEWRPLCLTA